MKRSLHNYLILLLLICSCHTAFSQKIQVDDTVGLEQLIQDNLVKNSCVDITNITSSVNGNSHGLPSYAYFEKGSSNFPFQNGIMLSTGKATSGGNSTITPTLNEGSTVWGTDPDLEAALGISNTLNATSIEFDIVSISNQLQFNYLLASEEYFGTNPCEYSDGFAFLIKEAGSSNPYTNIALVPGTTTSVNTNTIHDAIYPACPAKNAQYFDGYNMGDTNYNGRTKVLTASATIEPHKQYHIKLIIADQTDGTFDSAVFIEGNSFKILDLGDDITTCASSVTLNADIQNPLATYQWYFNNSAIPISGQNNPTLTVIGNGTYRVEVTVPLNNANCVEEDEIVVVLNTEEPIKPITNYELCDNNGTGIQIFDLSTKSAELVANIPFTSYSFSYHWSNADARTNSNPITTPIQNTSNPQTIYVRIDDLSSNCFAYTTFDLIVNQPPPIVNPTPLEVCDTDEYPNGFAIVYLTEKDDEITNGQSNLAVTYHHTAADANTGDNPIQSPYINAAPTSTVYARIINTQTGCVSTTTLDVIVTISPILNRDVRYLDGCDTDHDGFDNFDLTEVIANIEGGLPNVTTTFHESTADAQSGTNPITNPTNYQNISPEEQTIFVRVEDDITGCATVVRLELHTNLLLTGTNTGDYAICDTNENDSDAFDFYLSAIEIDIINELPFPIEVTFYESEDDRDNNRNPIPKHIPYSAVSPKKLYIKMLNTDSVCTEVSEITLLVNPLIFFKSTDPLPFCDTDDDGIVNIDLHSYDDLITNGNTDFKVSYFLDPVDANNNDSSKVLPPFYPSSGIQEFFARITNNTTTCHTVNSFKIEVIKAPSTNPVTDIAPICDDDQDGFSVIDLNDKIDEAVSNRIGLNISVHNALADTNSGANPIPVTDWSAYKSNTQTLYIRVQDALSTTGCFAIEPFEVIVNTLPIFPVISNYQICVNNGGTVADFILSEKDAEILNGQTGKEVYYFKDAALTLPIDKNAIYNNTLAQEIIYVKVENTTDATCFGTSTFILQVSPDPVYNTNFVDFFVCDDSSNDGKDVFNLEEKRTEIKQGSTDNLNISFHETPEQAENNSGALPNQYTNLKNPQTLYVRIESSDSFCYVVETLTINIYVAPKITPVKSPLIACDADYDGITSFNLETANFEIQERNPLNFTKHYFENQTDINPNDGFDNSKAITNPANFSSSSKIVYIKVMNTLTSCFSVIPLELIVNLPPAMNTIGTIEICDNDTKTYELLQVNTKLVSNPSTVNITYHNTLNDATANVLPINTTYNYTTNNHTIFVRVSNPTTGCFIVQEFNLQINPNPVANTPADLVSCDDDFDGFFEFNLASSTNTILGTQASSLFTVTYYNDLTKAETATNPLNNLHSAANGDIIYARLTNNTTQCYDIAQFKTIVNPLPVIPINDIVPLCINDLPLIIDASTGNTGDRYLWSTTVNPSVNNATSSEIQLDITDLGVYSVTVTTPDNCKYTKTFTVIESEKATINFTTTVDFADPNSITVNIKGIGDYVFILDDGEPQTSNVFDNVSYGVHTVTIKDLNGCEDVTTEVVVIDIPKFFTPNNDGFNDAWHIIGIDRLPGTIVYIYNRYGKLIKTLLHTSAGWNGTYNGENMPADDYWFVAKVIQNGNAFDVKGHFALKR